MDLLLDGNRGVYLPKVFAMMFGDKLKPGSVESDDIHTLTLGPDQNEFYWEIWDDVLRSAVYVDRGKEYTLVMDQDLFVKPKK